MALSVEAQTILRKIRAEVDDHWIRRTKDGVKALIDRTLAASFTQRKEET